MTVASHTADVPSPTRTERRWLIALLVLAALLREGIICWKPDSLAEDRDLYWGIAKRVAAGDGYVHPDLGHPTAYRPPLYPLLLAAIVFCGGGPMTLGIVQTTLGVATVGLTWLLARKLGLMSNALLAAAFVALNPLLVQTGSVAMTETLCGFLLMCLMTRRFESQDVAWKSRWLLGALFGLTSQCRPTVWAFAVLAAVAITARWLWHCRSGLHRTFREEMRVWCPVVVACGLTIAPWVLRNQILFGRPIVTTTHGGYTLLLGNNDDAHAAEIAQPTDTPWDSREFQRIWDVTFRQFGIEGWDEVRRDKTMSQAAVNWIVRKPGRFAESCWLRVKRFWNIFPGGSDAGSLPTLARWGIAVFFAVELLAAAIGLWRLHRDEWSQWWPLVLLVVSFALVHVVYWSNLRMRAPVEPMLALLAARGLTSRRSAIPSRQYRTLDVFIRRASNGLEDERIG